MLAGDRAALVKLSSVVTGFLAHYRAYEQRDSWDDLVQEVLIAVIRAGRDGRIRDPRALVGYVGMITRNKLYDWRSHENRPGRPDHEGDPEGAAARQEPAEKRADDPGLRMDLERCLGKLPDRQRLVIEAVYIEGESYEEAARRSSRRWLAQARPNRGLEGPSRLHARGVTDAVIRSSAPPDLSTDGPARGSQEGARACR